MRTMGQRKHRKDPVPLCARERMEPDVLFDARIPCASNPCPLELRIRFDVHAAICFTRCSFGLLVPFVRSCLGEYARISRVSWLPETPASSFSCVYEVRRGAFQSDPTNHRSSEFVLIERTRCDGFVRLLAMLFRRRSNREHEEITMPIVVDTIYA